MNERPEKDGAVGETEKAPPPDVGSDRAAPGSSNVAKSKPLPIGEIEEQEDDAKGG